jgi:hypothetical protein
MLSPRQTALSDDGLAQLRRDESANVLLSLARRFYASVTLDPNRAGRDVGRIGEEVLQHLTTLEGANVRITLDV